MIESRQATLTSLRARLAALGGTTSAPARRPRRVVSPSLRAAELGFHAEQTASGHPEVFVRRLQVDLEPFLDRAALNGPVPVGSLLALLGHPCGGEESAWLSSEGVGVLDIESLGLRGSGVMAFLVGLGVQRGGVLHAEQHLLVDPDGEAGLLAAVAAVIGSHRLWLTYNGRSFDVPVLAARCTVNRIDPDAVRPRLHGDLLGPVRRLFRDRLGPCTLRHAEMSLLNHHRVDDVPGSEAPARYRAWLRGAPTPVLTGVIAHNLQDIISTVVLAARLASHVGGEPVSPAHNADSYHLGRHHERHGVADAAEVELRASVTSGVDPWARQAAHRLAILLQRRGEVGEALEVWRRLHESDHRDLRAASGYAIRLERSGQLMAALEVCLRVQRVRDELGRWWPRWRGGGEAADLQWDRRERRLRRRLHS